MVLIFTICTANTADAYIAATTNTANTADDCGGLLRKIAEQGKQEFSRVLRIKRRYFAGFMTKESYLICKICLGNMI